VPRVSPQRQYDRHRFLCEAWLHFQSLYTILPMNQQWELHAYYRPSEQLSEAELREHQHTVAKQQRELPSKAGKHFNQLYRAFRTAFEHSRGDSRRFNAAIAELGHATTHPTRRGSVRVSAVARPEPDLRRLARALLIEAKRSGK
jgi:hypothetical protein